MMRARTQRDCENSNRLQRLWILTEILAILAKVSENEVVIRSAPVWSATRWQSRLGTCAYGIAEGIFCSRNTGKPETEASIGDTGQVSEASCQRFPLSSGFLVGKLGR